MTANVTPRDRRRHRRALLNAHDKIMILARSIRLGDAVALDGPHVTRDVAFCLSIAADIRRQLVDQAAQ